MIVLNMKSTPEIVNPIAKKQYSGLKAPVCEMNGTATVTLPLDFDHIKHMISVKNVSVEAMNVFDRSRTLSRICQ